MKREPVVATISRDEVTAAGIFVQAKASVLSIRQHLYRRRKRYMALRHKFRRLRTASVLDLVRKHICSLLYNELLGLQVPLQLCCKLSGRRWKLVIFIVIPGQKL